MTLGQKRNLMDSDDLKTALATCLDAIDNGGSFATSKRYRDLNPGLHIDGLGYFGLPLSPAEIKRIVQDSRQAPFGKGSETIVDTSVRNTWEVDASRLKLEHPDWRKDKILAEVCERMAIPGGCEHVEAQLYKLLIYEEGAMFKPHKDTEKAEGMFGTMVVCLPSQHEGGDLVLSFNNKVERFNSAASSKWSSSVFAWYADVLHEVEPVSSGYRVALTFNLVHKSASSLPNLALADATEQRLAMCSILKEWVALWHAMDDHTDEDAPEVWMPNQLVYVLDHEYSEANLRLDHLKGRDRVRIGMLVDEAQKAGLASYLCVIEKSEHGPVCEQDPTDVMYICGTPSDISDGYNDHHSLMDVEDESYELRTVVDLQGHVLGGDITLEEDDFVKPYESHRRPDEEEFGGWTGNEGASTTHWYRDTALIMMPREWVAEFFVSGGAASLEVRNVLRTEFQKWRAAQEDQPQRTEVLRLCTVAIDKFKDKAMLELVVIVCLELDSMDLAEKAFASATDSLTADAPGALSRAVERHGFEALRQCLETAIRHCTTPVQLTGMLHSLKTNHNIKDGDDFNRWETEKMERCLSVATGLQTTDAKLLVDMACSNQEEDGSWMTNILLPLIQRNTNSTLFCLVLSRELAFAIHENRLASGCVTAPLATSLTGCLAPPSGVPAEPEGCDAQDLKFVHRVLLENSLPECMVSLVDSAKRLASSADGSTFTELLLPFLQGVQETLKSTNRSDLQTSPHPALFRHVVEQYILRWVGSEPKRPRNWIQDERTSCGCKECDNTNHWLTSDEEEGRFRVNTERRKHIELTLGIFAHADAVSELQGNCNFLAKTVKDGLPHTLVVTKTTRPWERAHEEWKEREMLARTNLRLFLNFDEELRSILDGSFEGTDLFSELQSETNVNMLDLPKPMSMTTQLRHDSGRLLHELEPGRTEHWLRRCFVTEEGSELEASVVLGAYYDTFPATKTGQETLRPRELYKKVERVLSCKEGPSESDGRRIFRGIRERTMGEPAAFAEVDVTRPPLGEIANPAASKPTSSTGAAQGKRKRSHQEGEPAAKRKQASPEVVDLS